jgi:hypothetical protein
LEANLHGHIKEPEKKLQDRDAYKEQLETTIHGLTCRRESSVVIEK